jgi:thiamine transport system substrate-binding protein
MVKKLIVLTVILLMSYTFAAAAGTADSSSDSAGTASSETAAESAGELRIYAYDSFASEWGPGPAAAEMFTRKYGIKVSLISAGDSGQVLQRAILEKNAPKADIIIGIDDNLIQRALKENILQSYRSPAVDNVPEALHFDKTYHVTPYDYGFFAFIFDTASSLPKPKSLSELTDPIYKKSIIIMDPRTSSPGIGLLHWTISRFGNDYLDYWERLKPSLLTVTDGWSNGYGLFTAGEAPMVLSYTTSPAYHVEYENSDRYEALIFEEGHYMQIEGAGILQGAQNPEEAKLFIDFLLSPSVQELIPLTNWMYPAAADTKLPESFSYAPEPPSAVSLHPDDVSRNLDIRLKAWTETMSR